MAPDLARRVAITGAGAIGSFGIGAGALWDAVGAGDRTFAPCTRYPGTLPCAEAVRPDLRRMLHTGQTSRMVARVAVRHRGGAPRADPGAALHREGERPDR